MGSSLRLSPEDHRRHRWKVDEVAADFDLIDVWRTPMTGGPDQLGDALDTFESIDPSKGSGWGLARALFALREWMGRVFGWDREANALPIPGCTETSVRDRLPAEDRAPLPPPGDAAFPFRPVYRGRDEAFSELSNSTVHALMQLCWVPDGDGHRAHMAVYVKHRGRLGRLYMALIAPFRHLIVYPALMRRLGQAWRERGVSGTE